MIEYREKPDIIKYTTPIINCGLLNKPRLIKDELINEAKTSNKNIISNGYWLDINGNLHYFKVPITNLGFLKELLGEKVTNYFSLPSVHYELAEGSYINYKTEYHCYGLVSKWARKDDCYYETIESIIENIKKTDESIINFDSSDLSILEFLSTIYPNQPILKELRYFIIREFFTQEADRLGEELLIETDKDKTQIGPLLDYECEWIGLQPYKLKKYLTLNFEDKSILEYIKNDIYFQEALYKLMDINLLKLLKEVEEEHKIRLIDYDKQYFTDHERKIKKYIRNTRII